MSMQSINGIFSGCGEFSPEIVEFGVCTVISMPTLPDYPEVSQIQPKSPSLPYTNMKESTKVHFFTQVLVDFWHFGRKIFWIFDAFLWLNPQSSTLKKLFLGARR